MVKVFAWAQAGFLLALSIPLACVASAGRAHTVTRIWVAGKERPQAPATVILSRKKTDHTIAKGEVIYDGATIETPAGVKIELSSTGSKSTTTIGPNSTYTPTLTGGGESADVGGGNVFFSVVHGALDFFRVNHTQQFSASVQGTQFDLDTTGGGVAFACTRGAVDVQKTGLMSIGNQTSQISLVDVVSAGGTSHIVYHPSPNWYLAKFSNAQQATAYFNLRLAEARRSGNPFAISAAIANQKVVVQTFHLKSSQPPVTSRKPLPVKPAPVAPSKPGSGDFFKKLFHKIQKQIAKPLPNASSGHQLKIPAKIRPTPRSTHR